MFPNHILYALICGIMIGIYFFDRIGARNRLETYRLLDAATLSSQIPPFWPIGTKSRNILFSNGGISLSSLICSTKFPECQLLLVNDFFSINSTIVQKKQSKIIVKGYGSTFTSCHAFLRFHYALPSYIRNDQIMKAF